MVLNKEVQAATQQFMERLPLGHHPAMSTSGTGTSSGTGVGTLYLQLTVDDLGICLPSNPLSQVREDASNMVNFQMII